MKNYLLFLLCFNMIQAAETVIVRQPTRTRLMGYADLTDEQRSEVDCKSSLRRGAVCCAPGAVVVSGGATGLALTASTNSVFPCLIFSLLVCIGTIPMAYAGCYKCIRQNNLDADCFETDWIKRIQSRPPITGNVS